MKQKIAVSLTIFFSLLLMILPCVNAQDATPTPMPVGETLHQDIIVGLAIVFFFAIFNTLFILMKPCLEVMILSLVVMAFTIIIGALIVIPINQMLGIFMIVYSVFAFFITVLRVQV